MKIVACLLAAIFLAGCIPGAGAGGGSGNSGLWGGASQGVGTIIGR